MKLLLTSKGVTNNSIRNVFQKLLVKDVSKSNIAFVTTAGYFARSDKKWFVDQMLGVRNLNPQFFEIIELNALDRAEIVKRLNNADAVWLSGGNAPALLHAIDKKDLRDVFRKVAEQKVYCGISASSHIASPDLKLSNKEKREEYQKKTGYKADTALGFVDFYVRAHYLAAGHPEITTEYINAAAKTLGGKKLYAIDDDSAVVVKGSEVEVVTEGEVLVI